MNEKDIEGARVVVAEACRVAAARGGLMEGILGHISFRVSPPDLLLIRCRSADDTGVAYTRPSDIRLVRFDGTAGAPGELDNGYQVPKELPVHVESMRASPDIRAVAHLHPPRRLSQPT